MLVFCMITAGPTHLFSVIMNVTDQLSLSGLKTFWYSRESCKFHQSCPHDPFNLKSFILCCVKRDNQSPSFRDKEKKPLHEKLLKISVNMEISVAKRKARGTYKTLKTLQIPQTKSSFHFHHRFLHFREKHQWEERPNHGTKLFQVSEYFL